VKTIRYPQSSPTPPFRGVGLWTRDKSMDSSFLPSRKKAPANGLLLVSDRCRLKRHLSEGHRGGRRPPGRVCDTCRNQTLECLRPRPDRGLGVVLRTFFEDVQQTRSVCKGSSAAGSADLREIRFAFLCMTDSGVPARGLSYHLGRRPVRVGAVSRPAGKADGTAPAPGPIRVRRDAALGHH
jgi:hypothetical protein